MISATCNVAKFNFGVMLIDMPLKKLFNSSLMYFLNVAPLQKPIFGFGCQSYQPVPAQSAHSQFECCTDILVCDIIAFFSQSTKTTGALDFVTGGEYEVNIAQE